MLLFLPVYIGRPFVFSTVLAHTTSGTNITEIEWVPYAFIVEEGSLVPVKVAVTDCTQEVMSVVIMLLLSNRYTKFFILTLYSPLVTTYITFF
jgi:hypothetical protein